MEETENRYLGEGGREGYTFEPAALPNGLHLVNMITITAPFQYKC